MPTFTISELAREFERDAARDPLLRGPGLLAPARTGTRRAPALYSQRDRTRLKLTLRGKRLGLTLSEVRELVDMYESPSDTVRSSPRFLAVLGATPAHARAAAAGPARDPRGNRHAHEQRARALLAQADQPQQEDTPC